MKTNILSALAICLLPLSIQAQKEIHVSLDGDDNASGTIEAPLASITKAIELIEPGGAIYIHEGTYYIDSRIVIPEKNTSEDARIKICSYESDQVIIDGSKIKTSGKIDFKMARCMYFPYWANYWHVQGLTFQNAKDNGVKVEGSYNIFENCVFRGNNDTGLQIGMFKDWSIEETKGFPIKGTPEYNPDYTYCRGNKIINCDAYNNYDALQYDGRADDGGDADGFACKLFPGPGNEFYGCRAWNNSDDNWDLYMIYHPVVIDHCIAWNAGMDAEGKRTPGNGNGFKLGGGGSSGGAAFDRSIGAHVIRNCVAFSNPVKGFDQNNAMEGMYMFNCVAWGNDYNYRFAKEFVYGNMYIRNCVGFLAGTRNHEFKSNNGLDTKYNSWTLLDGCDPLKDGNKVNGSKVYAKDYSNQFASLSEELAKEARNDDGSLPENDFCRLVDGSILIDKGESIENFEPLRFMSNTDADKFNIELPELEPVTIKYNGEAPDLGAFESGKAGSVGNITIKDMGNIKCYIAQGAIIIDRPEDIVSATLYSIDGNIVASTTQSSVLPLPSSSAGFHLLQVMTGNRQIYTLKLNIVR